MKKSLIILVLFSFNLLDAQNSKVLRVEDAEEFFQSQNYLSAIPIFKAELKKDPTNPGLKYRLGVCYINARMNRAEAVTLLEAASQDKLIEYDVWMFLGRAYHLNSRVEEAITAFQKFSTLEPKRADEVEHYIEQCENALELMKKPLNVTFQNLGKEINSSEPDYYPFIDRDETALVFTSRRKENLGGKKIEVDGYRSSDIYQSEMLNGAWAPAKNVGRTVNGNLDEQVVGLRPDGLEMYVYMDHIEKFGDIYTSQRKSLTTEFLKPRPCDPIINAQIESSGCLNAEGTTIFFTRRSKLTDNSDLYMARKLPSGKWGLPQLLPDVINTPFNEDMPYLSYDGQTLYFASEGHNSMGGYDLFKTTWDEEANTFSKPENLGFPINTTDDERSICVTRDNKLGYVSAFRPNGFGDLDIYRVKLDVRDPVSVIYTGRMLLGDSVTANNVKSYDVKITVNDVKTNQEFYYVPHSSTGKYVMALPAGTYKLVTYCKGYARYKEEFTVSDMGTVNVERQKDIRLRKLNKQ